jgi:hypothetical protein
VNPNRQDLCYDRNAMGTDLVRIRLVTQLAVLVGVVFAASLAVAASASAYLYWDDHDAIARSNVDGSGVISEFIPNLGTLSGGGAINGSYLYFARETGVVGRVHLNGTDLDSDLFTLPQPPEGPESREINADCIVFAGNYIYWSTNSKGIGRATLNGEGLEPEFIKAESQIADIGIDGDHIYWITEHYAIARANLDGTDVEPDFIPLQSIPETATSATEKAVAEGHAIPLRGNQGINIDIANGYVYWTTSFLPSGIGRVSLAERHVQPNFITNVGYVGKITTAGRYIYWQSDATPSDQERWVGRAYLNGTAVVKHLVAETNTLQWLMAADTLGPGGESPAARHRHSHRRHRSK